MSEHSRDGSSATYQVYAKLKYEMEPIENCTRPHIVIDSEVDPRPHAKNLSKWLRGGLDKVPGTKLYKERTKTKTEETKLDFYTDEEA